MVPVTEVVTHFSESSADIAATWTKAAEVLLSQPGCTAVRYGAVHEDPTKFLIFIDWDAKSSHMAFTVKPIYQPFIADLAAVGTVKGYFHMETRPFPPTVLDGVSTPIVEVLTAYFPANYTAAQQEATSKRIDEFFAALDSLNIPGKTKEVGHGWAVEELELNGEKTRGLVGFIGWESIDAHLAFRETEGFKKVIPILRDLEDLKTIDMYHTKITVIKQS